MCILAVAIFQFEGLHNQFQTGEEFDPFSFSVRPPYVCAVNVSYADTKNPEYRALGNIKSYVISRREFIKSGTRVFLAKLS